MINDYIQPYFIVQSYSTLISVMIFIVGAVVFKYSLNYLDGYKYKKSYLLKLILLILSTVLLVHANHIVIFIALFVISNMILANMMPHNCKWEASMESKRLAQRNFLCASSLLTIGLGILKINAGSFYISDILLLESSHWGITFSLLLIVLAAFCQSAIWPFHKWLLSSLNSPTPTSAVMHAGLVNGGGIILIKLHPLFFNDLFILHTIFIFGLLTALLGILFKLVQPNYKNILACSTSGQMGFMFMQFSLGLLPAVVTHLICHSLFKSYLFLNHAEQANTYNLKKSSKAKQKGLLSALCFGSIGALLFHTLMFGFTLQYNTSLFITFSSLVLCTHIAMSTLDVYRNKIITFYLVLMISLVHALLLTTFEYLIHDSLAMNYYNLNILHFLGIATLSITWGAFEVYRSKKEGSVSSLYDRVYVWLLNSSMPKSNTITSAQSGYRYI